MRIAVIGGDKRMLFAAREFLSEGHEVCVAGFDSLLSVCGIRSIDVFQAALWAEIIVLPVRPLRGEYLNAPFTDEQIKLGLLLNKAGRKPLFCGCADQVAPYTAARVFDYASREDFTYRNALLTAEGALSLILNDYEGSVYNSRILVTGYGRIGKLLSEMLRSMGAVVTVAARRLSDRSLIQLRGMTAAKYTEIDYSLYPIIINTVPAPVISVDAVDHMREDVFLVDLASMPGGVDCIRARERGLTCIHALSLPGKTAPLAAGRIIKDTILTILSETDISLSE